MLKAPQDWSAVQLQLAPELHNVLPKRLYALSSSQQLLNVCWQLQVGVRGYCLQQQCPASSTF